MCWYRRGGSRASKPVLAHSKLKIESHFVGDAKRRFPVNLCWRKCGGSRAGTLALVHTKGKVSFLETLKEDVGAQGGL